MNLNMFPFDHFSGAVVVLIFALVAQNTSFFKKKAIWHMSILQTLYLVIFPGVLFSIFYAYLEVVKARPLIEAPFLSDITLTNIIMLAVFFTYGGVAIHAVTKMLSETSLRYEDSEEAQINRYFHRKFSHNLIYSGSLSTVVGLTLLELNHTPGSGYDGWWPPIIQGGTAGFIIIASMYIYTHSKDNYTGRWADLKAAFLTLWVGFILLLYGAWRANPSLKEYQLIVPVMSSLTLIAILNIGLIIRRIRLSRRS
jgi:hypothetical protein